MPKVYNKHHKNVPKDAIYVGRPSKYGNPFVIGKDGTREEVIAKYRKLMTKLPLNSLVIHIKQQLRDKDLVCWCSPKPCHADVLLEIANAKDPD